MLYEVLFFYICHIYVIFFIIYLLHIYMYIICFYILFSHYLIQIYVITLLFSLYEQNCYNKKNLIIIKNYYHNKNILMIRIFCYIKIFILWFSHAIRLVKSGLQFEFKIICIQDIVYYTLSD